MNVNFGLFPPIEGRMKKANRKQLYTKRAKDDLRSWVSNCSSPPASADADAAQLSHIPAE